MVMTRDGAIRFMYVWLATHSVDSGCTSIELMGSFATIMGAFPCTVYFSSSYNHRTSLRLRPVRVSASFLMHNQQNGTLYMKLNGCYATELSVVKCKIEVQI